MLRQRHGLAMTVFLCWLWAFGESLDGANERQTHRHNWWKQKRNREELKIQITYLGGKKCFHCFPFFFTFHFSTNFPSSLHRRVECSIRIRTQTHNFIAFVDLSSDMILAWPVCVFVQSHTLLPPTHIDRNFHYTFTRNEFLQVFSFSSSSLSLSLSVSFSEFIGTF